MWIGIILSILPSAVMSSSPWSLIQAKSLVKDNIGVVSSMDEALTFVQELAEKVAGHDVPLTETEKKAVDTIQAYVKRLLEDIKKQRNQDQNEVNRYRQVVKSCADTAKEMLDGAVTNLRTQSDSARNSHAKCRREEGSQATETATECSKYDAYRSAPAGGAPPKCMQTLSFSDVRTTDAATKKSMEQCLTAIQVWLNPLYDLYLKCKQMRDDHLAETQRCDGKQSAFEADFCQYSTALTGTCSTQTSCRSKNMELLKKGDAEIEIDEKARQADCEVGHKIDCLLKVFEESDNKKKTGILDECKKLTPSCPDKIDYPPVPGLTPCTEEASVPCEDAWLEKEYTSQSWYALAPTKSCHACAAPHPCRASLYEHEHFKGWKASFTPGHWNTRELKRAGAKDDHASSIKVEDGCLAVVFENPDLSGKKGAFPPGEYNHDEFIKIFPNDKVSSMQVYGKLKFELGARCGDERVTLRVGDKVQTLTLTQGWHAFEFDFPPEGKYEISLDNDGGSCPGREDFGKDILGGFRGNNRDAIFRSDNGEDITYPGLWGSWHCNDPSKRNVRCGMVAGGLIGWGGKFILTLP